jgi:hypothetical protein
MIDVNQVDEKGWTPAILLVMNLHNIQKEPTKLEQALAASPQRADQSISRGVVAQTVIANENLAW